MIFFLNSINFISDLFSSPRTAAPAWLLLFILLYFILTVLDRRYKRIINMNFIEKNIDLIIMPFVYDAIVTAYKMSERSIDDLQRRMSGVDKLQFATMVYDMLPQYIMGVDREIIYKLIPKAEFANMVSAAVKQVNKFIDDKQEAFDEAYQDWLEELPPANANQK